MKKKIALLTSAWSVDYVLSIIEGLQIACKKNNLDLYVFSCYKFSEPDGTQNTTGFAIFDLINYKDFDGVIITPNLFNDSEIAEREAEKIRKAKIPAVTIAAELKGLHFINTDNHENYKDLIRHLIKDHSAKKIAFAGGPAGNPGAEANFKAYKEVLEENKIPLRDEYIFLDGDWSAATAYKQAVKLLELKDLPEAVVCVNDITAMALSKAAIERGIRIPDKLKLIGFDDITMAEKIIPSITTVSTNEIEMAKEAVNLLLKKFNSPKTVNIPAKTFRRQSCGCEKEISLSQILYTQNFPKKLDEAQRFASQLRHLEDVFIEHQTVEDLTENLQLYFEKRHFFEGPDFAILLKDEVVKTLNSVRVADKDSGTFGKEVQVITHIQNGKPAPIEKIKAKSLIPESMKSDESAVFLFLPIYNQRYLHGYYVSRNCTRLLEEKNAYNWTRNIGTIIEKFRQTLIYRTMSEQHKMLSTRDALSGLLNRTGLDIFGNEMFLQNNQNQIKTEIIFIDINNMKIINDEHGHLHGDLAVKTVAEAISAALPENYLGIRYGGDEFVVMGPYKKKDLFTVIKNQIKTKSESLSLPYDITASIGAKVFLPDEKTDLLAAIQEVDEIMYQEKQKFHNSEKKKN